MRSELPGWLGQMRQRVDDLRETINNVVGRALDGARSCALLDFPDHSNVGDSAIWLGELALLQQFDVDVRYICTWRNYRADTVAERLDPDSPILIHGGGNLGDLWPHHQRLREQVILDFPRRRIIQLPQSIHFGSHNRLARTQDILSTHDRFTLLVRDKQSQRIAQDLLNTTSTLCPDLAFYLGSDSRGIDTAVDVMALLRTDQESRSHGDLGLDDRSDLSMERADWIRQPRPYATGPSYVRAARFISMAGRRLMKKTLESNQAMRHRIYRRRAAREVDRGLDILRRGRVVTTDRLHGHILSVLLGIPHALLDNAYGKVSSFHEMWTRDLEAVRMCLEPRELSGEVPELLRLTATDRAG